MGVFVEFWLISYSLLTTIIILPLGAIVSLRYQPLLVPFRGTVPAPSCRQEILPRGPFSFSFLTTWRPRPWTASIAMTTLPPLWGWPGLCNHLASPRIRLCSGSSRQRSVFATCALSGLFLSSDITPTSRNSQKCLAQYSLSSSNSSPNYAGYPPPPGWVYLP